jgi:hypothetical protein
MLVWRWRAGRGGCPCPLFDRERPFVAAVLAGRSCPICMDRLPFASEALLSEVADLYPAC